MQCFWKETLLSINDPKNHFKCRYIVRKELKDMQMRIVYLKLSKSDYTHLKRLAMGTVYI